MSRFGRASYVVIVLIGLVLAWWRLKEQGVPVADVASTGLLFVVGLAAFFAILLGIGKLLGRLFHGR